MIAFSLEWLVRFAEHGLRIPTRHFKYRKKHSGLNLQMRVLRSYTELRLKGTQQIREQP